MNPGTLRALEFDRIVAIAAGLTVTPLGYERMLDLRPLTDPGRISHAQRLTTEGTRALTNLQAFPLQASPELSLTLQGLAVEGRPLEPLRLIGLADFLDTIEATATAIKRLTGSFPLLIAIAGAVASFKTEVTDVRRKLDPGGEVLDNASPALAHIRERLRRQRARLRTTLDALIRNRDTAKYLQDQVVTDRNGRYVVMVRAEHRGAIPGLVHGGSASGATLFLEPLETVEINNEVVTLQEAEAEEIRRILLALTDAFRHRPADLERTFEKATELDVVQACARLSALMDGTEPATSTDGTFELRKARHPLLIGAVASRDSGFGIRRTFGIRRDARILRSKGRIKDCMVPSTHTQVVHPDRIPNPACPPKRRARRWESRIPSLSTSSSRRPPAC